MRLFLIVLLSGFSYIYAVAQTPDSSTPANNNDTVPRHAIGFTPSSASEYIVNLLKLDSLWREPGDTIHLSLNRLIDHYNEPFDSVGQRLSRFDYESARPELTELERSDTLSLRWLNDSVFIVDTMALEKAPYITRKTIVTNEIDTLNYWGLDTIPDVEAVIDSIKHARDTIEEVFIDSLYLKSENIRMHRVIDQEVRPPLLPPESRKQVNFLPDSSQIVISEQYQEFVADDDSPFYVVPGAMMPDSLRMAVEELLHYTDNRDSIPLYISDSRGEGKSFWLTNESNDLRRYWVRNHENDSITIWVGNPSKNEIQLVLEDDIQVERMKKLTADDIPITTLEPDRSLVSLQSLKQIPGTWRYSLSSAFTLNQNYLSNWAKGGESSLSSLLDLQGTAEYRNIESEIHWTNTGRLKYGNVISEEFGFRTNTDILELNSQFNKEVGEKIDFSSVFYGKTQISKGYNYPNDSIPISKFLSPGAFTVGVGFEYQPFNKAKINFSALSYRNTFVLDTLEINQRAHGIEHGKRSRQEMGGQLVIKNELSLLDDLKIENSVRLFSNYLKNPQNVDVDWEINLEKQISWYFTVRMNFHFIYDENILFPVYDQQGDPVTLPDGSKKEVPRLQLKQFLGVTMSFSI
ncbi:MAG: DUF3078 domain-containing protein [Bacteroidales bacterium]